MMDERLQRRLKDIEQHYVQLEEMMADEEISTDPKRLMEIARERAEQTQLVETYRRYMDTERQVREAEEMRDGSDPELEQMAREELERLEPQLQANLEEIKRLLLPKDP